MLANREGRFLALTTDKGLSETGRDVKKLTYTASYMLTHEWADGEWRDITTEGLTITGYFYLEKNDGTLNEFQIKKLMDAYGWDGKDYFYLQDADVSSQYVQLTLALDTYDGRTSMKVKWIDAQDATGGVSKADDAERKAIASRIGSKWRANFGGVAVPAGKPKGKPVAVEAAKPNGGLAGQHTPAAPAPQTPTKPPPARKPPATATPPTPPPAEPEPLSAEQAWGRWNELAPKTATPEKIEAEWFRIQAEMFGDREPTPAEFGQLVTAGLSRFVPF